MAAARPDTVDRAEIARFAALAQTWWDPHGPMRALHRLNPTRLAWIKRQVCAHFARDPIDAKPFAGLRVLDIGCGAGILTEPLARMGGGVVGIDPSAETIAAARAHCEGSLSIEYRATTAEMLAEIGARFDVVTVLEVVEHVTDMPAFVGTCASLLNPGGMLVASTINRTPKAFLLAIVGAEYVLRWLPRGTHSYDRLVTPSELTVALRAAALKPVGATGVAYALFSDDWRLTTDMDVNYMLAATNGDRG
jgi:2-polyprenyl-6-hydroxyphenyl methylase/3-demethylubiquinone-9 3-methyltransferase